jgi:hypothetical protein
MAKLVEAFIQRPLDIQRENISSAGPKDNTLSAIDASLSSNVAQQIDDLDARRVPRFARKTKRR